MADSSKLIKKAECVKHLYIAGGHWSGSGCRYWDERSAAPMNGCCTFLIGCFFQCRCSYWWLGSCSADYDLTGREHPLLRCFGHYVYWLCLLVIFRLLNVLSFSWLRQYVGKLWVQSLPATVMKGQEIAMSKPHFFLWKEMRCEIGDWDKQTPFFFSLSFYLHLLSNRGAPCFWLIFGGEVNFCL